MKIVVCVGTGGVGKTSVSASLALRAALAGRRALVLTIDPARRLRSALALDTADGQQRVALPDYAGPGELWAALMDVKSVLDRAVRLYAEPRQAEIVLGHPIYQMLITSLSGMQELVAVERLDQAISEGFDVIVIDTAPSRHALEFLDKPEFFNELVSFPLVRLVGRTYKVWSRSPLSRLSGGALDLFRRVESILGPQLVSEVLDFFSVFQTVAEGFAERAQRTMRLLRRAGTTEFCIVAGPSRTARDVSFFWDELTRRRFPVSTLLVNRIWPEVADEVSPQASAQVREALDWYRDISRTQRAACDAVFDEFRDRLRHRQRIFELPRDIDGLPALRGIASQLDLPLGLE